MKSVLLFPRLSHSNISLYGTGGCSRDVLVGWAVESFKPGPCLTQKLFTLLLCLRQKTLFDQDPDSFRFRNEVEIIQTNDVELDFSMLVTQR